MPKIDRRETCQAVKSMSHEEKLFQKMCDRNTVLLELLAEEVTSRRESQQVRDGMAEMYNKAWDTLYKIGDIVKDTTNSKTLRKDIIKVLDEFYRY